MLDARGPAAPATLPQFSLYQPRPGHPDWSSLWSAAARAAAELAPELEAPRRGPAEWRRRLRSVAQVTGNFAANRRLARAGRQDLRPLYFIWTVTNRCNFLCTYCDDHRGCRYPELPNDGELSTSQGLDLLRVMRSGTSSVYFAGGEPTLRQDLPRLTRAARDLDYYPITINTNGSTVAQRLRDPAWRSWLADTDVVVVSLDSLELERMQRLWGHGRPERVVQNLLLLRQLSARLRFKLMVNAVIQPGHVRQARYVMDLAHDLGLWFCPVPVNVGPVIHPQLRQDPEYHDLARTIVQRKRAGHRVSGSPRMLRRLLWSAPLSCRNTLKPHVDHDGRLFWPCKASVNVDPLRLPVTDFADLAALYRHAAARVDPAGFHGAGPDQCGANCNWAQNYTTDAYAHGLLNPASLVGEMASFINSR